MASIQQSPLLNAMPRCLFSCVAGSCATAHGAREHGGCVRYDLRRADRFCVLPRPQNQRMCSMHPNIVQLREVFLTEHHLAVAMEYADGGDLSEYIDQQYQRGVRPGSVSHAQSA